MIITPCYPAVRALNNKIGEVEKEYHISVVFSTNIDNSDNQPDK